MRESSWPWPRTATQERRSWSGCHLSWLSAVLELGLTPEEALWAATRGGSMALELPDRGRLGPGALADMVVLDADSHLHLSYRPDADHTWKVVKRGVVVSG